MSRVPSVSNSEKNLRKATWIELFFRIYLIRGAHREVGEPGAVSLSSFRKSQKLRSLESLFWRSWSSEIVSGKVLGCSKPVWMVSDRIGMSSDLRIVNLHFAENLF